MVKQNTLGKKTAASQVEAAQKKVVKRKLPDYVKNAAKNVVGTGEAAGNVTKPKKTLADYENDLLKTNKLVAALRRKTKKAGRAFHTALESIENIENLKGKRSKKAAAELRAAKKERDKLDESISNMTEELHVLAAKARRLTNKIKALQAPIVAPTAPAKKDGGPAKEEPPARAPRPAPTTPRSRCSSGTAVVIAAAVGAGVGIGAYLVHEQIQPKLDQAQKEVERLAGVNSAAKTNLTDERGKLKETSDQYEAAKVDNAKDHEMITALNKEIAQLRGEQKYYKNELAKLQKNHKASVAKANQLRDIIAGHERRIRADEDLVKSLGGQVTSLTTERDNLKANKKTLEEQNKAAAAINVKLVETDVKQGEVIKQQQDANVVLGEVNHGLYDTLHITPGQGAATITEVQAQNDLVGKNVVFLKDGKPTTRTVTEVIGFEAGNGALLRCGHSKFWASGINPAWLTANIR